MKLHALLISELRFRGLSSLMVILAVLVATACGVGSAILLDHFDSQTDAQVAALQMRAGERMNALENEARLFAKALGFNVFIYNAKQNMGRFYTSDTSDYFLTLADAEKLADSNMDMLNHLLPVLRSRYSWTEYGEDVVIGGIKGEIFVKRKWQEPMEVELLPGEVHLGYTIHQKLDLVQGDDITLAGKTYKATQLRDRLGTKDDITLFMNLGDAQTLLNLPGKISGILALSCNCVPGEIEPLRKALQHVLPQTEIVELTVRAKARARARKTIQEAAREELKDIHNSRSSLRETLTRFSVLFFGLMTIASAILLLFLYGNNVKERRSEIAILRTIGLSTVHIYILFMLKALLLALIGSVLGSVLGVGLGVLLSDGVVVEVSYYLTLVGVAVAGSCIISLLASWIPARSAAAGDPGVILNEG